MIEANLRLVVKIAHHYSNLGRSPRGKSRSYGATQFNRGFSYGQRRELNAMSRLTSSEPAVPYLVRIWLIGTPAPGQDSLFQLQRRGRHRMMLKALFSELLCDSHSERWNEFELPKFSLVNWPRYTERKKSYVQGPVSRFVPL